MFMGDASAQPVGHDFNNDGITDYPVSITNYDELIPSAGAARMWSGASKTIINTIVSLDTNTLYGWSIASVGDVNNDGFDDIAVGEPLWGTPDAWEGRVHVYSGKDSSVLLTILGPYPDTGLGRYVAGVGDFNGDGTNDIASSGWVAVDIDSDGIADDAFGILFIFSGVNGTLLAEITDLTATDRFAYCVFGLGDLNADGRADIAVVDRRADGAPGTDAKGRIYIFSGQAQPATLSFADATHTLINDDPFLRGFGAQIDAMHPDLWLDNPTIQVVSLTTNGIGGVNEAEASYDIYSLDGSKVGTKGIRASLVLAGDVNLDGEVTIADLEESIGQMGSNPGASGTMPVADINKDGVIDELDIALVLQQFGEQTDVFEGLWEDSRLWSIAGGGSGFGNIPGSITPGGAIRPRPLDDCLFVVAGPDTLSRVPYLLGLDLRTNCAECPDCDDLDPNECYKCNDAGTLTPPSVTAIPSQPQPGETVYFDIEPATLTGRTRKCQPFCGDEGKVCHYESESIYPSWIIEKKNPDTGDWDIIKSSFLGDLPLVTESACAEIRITLLPVTIGTEDFCAELSTSPVSAEVQFASFTLTSETYKEAPDGTPSDRTTIGIGEKVTVSVVEPGAGVAQWYIEGSGSSPATRDTFTFSAPKTADTVIVVATINDCVRKRIFSVIEPLAVNYTPCPDTLRHIEGRKHAEFLLEIDLDPDNVCFYRVESREVSGPGTGGTGDFAGNEPYHNANTTWHFTYDDNRVGAVDSAGIDLPASDPRVGWWRWEIPREYRVPGGPVHRMAQLTTQIFRVTTECGLVHKGGQAGEGCIYGPGVDRTGSCFTD